MAQSQPPHRTRVHFEATSQDLSLILGPDTRGLRLKRLIARGGFGEVYEVRTLLKCN